MERKNSNDDGIEKINNHSVPVVENTNFLGKASGSSVVSAADFAKLMLMNKKHGGQNKSHNHKESKKANIRRNEKFEREAAKSFAIEQQKRMEQERIEWAPQDKDDEKFAKKMAAKMQPKGPSNKELNKKLAEEEEEKMSSKKKAKNGWGNTKN